MNVLMITGDRGLFKEGSNAWERLSVQRSAVEKLDVVYWGRGALTGIFFVKGGYDVVTVQDPLWRGLFACYAVWKLGAKFNVQVHMDLSGLSYMQQRLARMVLRRADTIRVVSNKIKDQVETIGVRGKIFVLPVFVDLGKFDTTGKKDHEGKNIVWIGRFEKEKNPLQAVAIVREVSRTLPEARLTMLGEGSMRKEIAAYAAGLPVNFPGWADPIPFLAAADVALCTSLYESWGASIVEALASGVPVVAPDVGIAREAGAIIAPREKLGEAIVRVLKDGGEGILKLRLLPKDGWAARWRETLI